MHRPVQKMDSRKLYRQALLLCSEATFPGKNNYRLVFGREWRMRRAQRWLVTTFGGGRKGSFDVFVNCVGRSCSYFVCSFSFTNISRQNRIHCPIPQNYTELPRISPHHPAQGGVTRFSACAIRSWSDRISRNYSLKFGPRASKNRASRYVEIASFKTQF